MPRTRRQVNHQIAFHRDELTQRIGSSVELARADHGMRPDIFADSDADAFSVMLDQDGLCGGLEIAVFIEDIVGRQQTLSRHGDDLARLTKRRGIVERAPGARFVEFNGTDERRNLADGRRDFLQRLFAIGDEAAFEEQIARWISAHDELGEHDELGALFNKRCVGIDDFASISNEIADGGIELRKAESHGREGGHRAWICMS
jgi:hypothetical protein